MGNIFGKTPEEQTDVITEALDKKTFDMLTNYKYYTKEEKQNIYNMSTCKLQKDYVNLVFEGGGIKGLAYCGAVKFLEEQNIMKNIKNYAGSSAGAIIACLLSLGYNSDEIKNLMESTDFSAFIDDSKFMPKNLYNLIENMGIASGNTFENWIETCIKNKTGNPDYTFKNLYDDKGIILITTGTNLNRGITIYFHKDSFPNMPIKTAVRISMSIPFLFEPCKYTMLDIDDLYVDGGCLDNFPLHLFDGKYPGDPQAILNLVEPNPKTLGLKLTTSDEKNNLQVEKRQNINGIKDLIENLLSTFMTSNERHLMRPSYWLRTISISVPDIPITQFTIDDKIKQSLNNSGYDCAKSFFENK